MNLKLFYGLFLRSTLFLAVLLLFTSFNANAQVSKGLISSEKNISFYPNPFQNSLTLDLKNLPADNKTVKVEVYNIIGKSFYKNEFKFQNSDVKFNIDLEILPPGVYFMYIINTDKKVFKIIKESTNTSFKVQDKATVRIIESA